jgi:threonine/homoserine/homoserine lactone efflux protein
VIDAAVLPAFILASAVLVAIPGPAVLFIVSTGIGRGRGAALASMAGIEVGALFHVFAATVGISAIVASSAVDFSVLKYAGAAYLVFLGWRTLRTGESSLTLRITGETSKARAFGRGIVVNVLNPKVALHLSRPRGQRGLDRQRLQIGRGR